MAGKLLKLKYFSSCTDLPGEKCGLGSPPSAWGRSVVGLARLDEFQGFQFCGQLEFLGQLVEEEQPCHILRIQRIVDALRKVGEYLLGRQSQLARLLVDNVVHVGLTVTIGLLERGAIPEVACGSAGPESKHKGLTGLLPPNL
jgi:hypothetical protein